MLKLVLRLAFSWLLSLKIWMVLAIILIASTPAKAEDEPLVRFLNAIVKEDGSMAYSVMPGMDLLLSFTGTPTTELGTALEFYLTSFSGEQGDSLTIEPYIVELPNSKPKGRRLLFSLERPVMTLKLNVPEVPTASNYNGNLIVLQEDRVKQTHPIVLTRAKVQRPALLTLDLKSILIHHTKSCMPWSQMQTWLKEPPSFTMLVRNLSSEWQAKGVFLRLLEVTTPDGANFDPRKNLTFTWNGKKTKDLWRSPSPEDTDTSPHVISPNHQAEISGEFHDLTPGEYTLKLGLAATNVAPQAEDQMTVKIRIRHTIVGAIVILLLAIAVSFIATKGLEALRRRTAVLKKTSELKLPLLGEDEDTAPVVSVRAILKQAEDRNKNWYTALLGPDVVSDRVNKAERMLGILRRVHQIHEKIKEWDQAIMIRYRAEKQLTEITADMVPETVNEKCATEIERKLDELEKWFNTDELCTLYWPNVKIRIDNLLCQAKPDEFSETTHREVVDKLIERINGQIDKIRQNPDTLNLTETAKIDEDYARLKILWECQQDNDTEALNSLVALIKDHASLRPGIRGFFKERDKVAWEKLKKAGAEKEKEWLKLTSPQKRTVHPIQAYELIQFKVESIPRDLGNNYLFRNGLEYHWSLYLKTQSWWRKETIPKTLTRPRTKEPRLVQYVPRKGELSVSVKLCYNNDCTTEVGTKEPLQIDKSKDFGWIRAFRFVEVTALAIATLFALISGLQIHYIGKSSFGSMGDYVTLFIWGAGVDQAKNFIQHLAQRAVKQL
ncbi:MAG: hypothetical protein GY774_19880 [Planctomycetes bacterium]|nr:hypothetical protein [Planctomycetota bacterium]